MANPMCKEDSLDLLGDSDSSANQGQDSDDVAALPCSIPKRSTVSARRSTRRPTLPRGSVSEDLDGIMSLRLTRVPTAADEDLQKENQLLHDRILELEERLRALDEPEASNVVTGSWCVHQLSIPPREGRGERTRAADGPVSQSRQRWKSAILTVMLQKARSRIVSARVDLIRKEADLRRARGAASEFQALLHSDRRASENSEAVAAKEISRLREELDAERASIEQERRRHKDQLFELERLSFLETATASKSVASIVDEEIIGRSNTDREETMCLSTSFNNLLRRSSMASSQGGDADESEYIRALEDKITDMTVDQTELPVLRQRVQELENTLAEQKEQQQQTLQITRPSWWSVFCAAPRAEQALSSLPSLEVPKSRKDNLALEGSKLKDPAHAKFPPS